MKKTKAKFLDVFIGVMIMIVVAVMPLIVQIAMRNLPPELLPYMSGQYPDGRYFDIFSYWKGVAVLVPAGLIAFFYINDVITSGKMPDYREFIRRPYVVLSGVYLLFVIISAIFSRYTHTAWLGTYDRGEGAFMWIAYFVVFFAVIYFVKDFARAKIVLFGLVFSSIIMGAIGVGQFIGHDFFGTMAGRWLITMDDELFRRHMDEITIEFPMSYGTLFNPNTFGKYTAMLSPVLLLAALTYDGKKYIRAIFLVAGALMLLGVFGSSSLGGLIGIITATVVLVVTFLCRPGIPVKRLGMAALPVVVLLLLAISFVPQLNYRVTFLFNRMQMAMRADTHGIQNYLFDGNTMTVVRGDNTIFSMTAESFDQGEFEEGEFEAWIERLWLNREWLTVRDGYGNIIHPYITENPGSETEPASLIYSFEIPGYRTISIEHFITANFFAYRHTHAADFFFLFEDGRLHGISPISRRSIDFADKVPAWGFYGRETWGSSRGHIWSRSFPLMPSRTIIGSGPDTFVNVFPKTEIVESHRFHFTSAFIVDKAHNMFIQTWITTGGISAIALFGLFAHYIFTTFMLLVKTKDMPMFAYGLRLGLLCAVSAYVMSGMATDTTVGSTGVFFALLGLGYGVNQIDKH
ncbi:MAG: O-antigen ligase family protein [Defluviitaleaceae bacterium]|nr:O-antigen ligase family protein [Defluviitaleaceae bacterium]